MATYHLLSWLISGSRRSSLPCKQWHFQLKPRDVNSCKYIGTNSHGQLGHGILSEQCVLPQEVDLSSCHLKAENIRKIVGGAGHSVILDKNGHVFSCGWNNKGQLGRPKDQDTLHFKRIDNILDNEDIVDIACGWDSSAALTKQGKLYMWGSNNFGQLGSSPLTVRHSDEPIEAIPTEKIERVAMGLRHTVVITQEHKVFVCGVNSKGQLGLNYEAYDLTDRNEKRKDFFSFTLVPELENAIEVSCGQHHTVVATDKAEVYVFGANNYGQLGIDNESMSMISSPTKLINIRFNLPIEIHAGWTHTEILNDNAIYAWGRNTYGQLGHVRPMPWKPDLIANLPKIKQLSVGSQHNIALTDDNVILCWGWNEHGNCGTGDTIDVATPRPVPIPQHSKGILIGTGAGHSFALIKK